MTLLRVHQGDITKLEVDAIVNAANTSLLGGGGVDGAIHRAAGPELVHACRLFGGCRTGEAVVTDGFRLPARWVIHTPGPVWRGGDAGERELLAASYRNSFARAGEVGARTVAFPCISTGIYRFPMAEAVRIAVREAKAAAGDGLDEVVFVCFSEADAEAYRAELGGESASV